MSLSKFQRRLKEAQKGGERISKIVEDEAEMKQRLREETAAQQQRLDRLNSDFEVLKQGGNLGTSSGT